MTNLLKVPYAATVVFTVRLKEEGTSLQEGTMRYIHPAYAGSLMMVGTGSNVVP